MATVIRRACQCPSNVFLRYSRLGVSKQAGIRNLYGQSFQSWVQNRFNDILFLLVIGIEISENITAFIHFMCTANVLFTSVSYFQHLHYTLNFLRNIPCTSVSLYKIWKKSTFTASWLCFDESVQACTCFEVYNSFYFTVAFTWNSKTAMCSCWIQHKNYFYWMH